jgi:hypothetical protein
VILAPPRHAVAGRARQQLRLPRSTQAAAVRTSASAGALMTMPAAYTEQKTRQSRLSLLMLLLSYFHLCCCATAATTPACTGNATLVPRVTVDMSLKPARRWDAAIRQVVSTYGWARSYGPLLDKWWIPHVDSFDPRISSLLEERVRTQLPEVWEEILGAVATFADLGHPQVRGARYRLRWGGCIPWPRCCDIFVRLSVRPALTPRWLLRRRSR